MAIEEIIMANPKPSIVVIAGFVSLFISFVNHLVLDKEKVRNSKAKQKDLRVKMKEHKHDTAKVMEFQKEMFSDSMENMRHSFKPMLITLLPILVVFYWIRGAFEGVLDGWIWWYIVSAVVFSMIFRKLFKLP
tara:strand:+ start:207 stop:605 length:399 start_codon:yes stop_codon:yes gene_type:complete